MGEQRVTGVDEVAWPDTRPPATPTHRGRTAAVVLIMLVAVVGGYAVVRQVSDRPSPVASDLSCPGGRFGGTIVDYQGDAGYPSPQAAIRAFIAGSPGQGLPQGGYHQIVIAPTDPAGSRGTSLQVHGADASSALAQTFVHRRGGRVDVVLDTELLSAHKWVVSRVGTCANR